MPRPHVSGDFCIRNFFSADTKISASTRGVYESYTTVHTYPIRIRTSQRNNQQSLRITKKAEPAIILAPNSRLSCLLIKTGSDTVTSAYKKYTHTSVHTYPDTQRIQKFPLWRAYTEISGYVWTGHESPKLSCCVLIKPRTHALHS